tara:strand:+ start:168 stop:581 length:414 start_codon:yes stop_codon:yes gene_type:complete
VALVTLFINLLNIEIMASLIKIPYGAVGAMPGSNPAYLAVNVEGVYSVTDNGGTDGITLYYDQYDATTPADYLNVVLNFKGAASVSAADITTFANLVAEASQAENSVPSFELEGDDGTDDYHLTQLTPLTLTAGAPV